MKKELTQEELTMFFALALQREQIQKKYHEVINAENELLKIIAKSNGIEYDASSERLTIEQEGDKTYIIVSPLPQLQ